MPLNFAAMAQTFDSKLSLVVCNYIKLLNVKVTKTSLKKGIEENPYYPSLLSLSDVLTRYNIANEAYKIETESFNELEAPFIAFASTPGVGSDFVLVTAITGETVSYLYDKKKPTTVTKTEFLKQFKSTVLFAEPGEESGEPDYDKKLAVEKATQIKKTWWGIAATVALILAITANVTAATALAFSIISVIKLTGLTAAILLLVFEINKNNAFVKNICGAGGKTNCDAVVGSKASKIFGISWAEVGFFYFASTTLFLLMPSVSFITKAALFSLANAFAAPYIVFSIYYQWRVVKQWCPLCLTVQAVLAAELIWGIVNFWVPVHSFSALLSAMSYYSPLGVGGCVLLPLVCWYAIKPVLLRAKDHDLYYNAYKRLQYNPETFNSLLIQQPKAADNWQQLGISIGNPAADNTIIKVCNPYCGPCAKAHPQLEQVITQNKNINLKIIFTARNNDYDIGAPVVKHLLAVAAQGNSVKTQQALDDWYLAGKKDYDAFVTKHPMNGDPKQQDKGIEAMSAWCNEAAITHTPTIFVNGYKLPENYNVDELQYIIK